MRRASHHEFFPDRYARRLESAKDIREIFQVVKDAVMDTEGWSRSGLTLGFAELDGSEGSLIGALHPLGTNLILLGPVPLRKVKESYTDLCKPYLFVVLMHEYVHTIGIVEQVDTRDRVLAIARTLFGEHHLVTKLAEDIKTYLPFVTYPTDLRLPEGTAIEPVEGFGNSSNDATKG